MNRGMRAPSSAARVSCLGVAGDRGASADASAPASRPVASRTPRAKPAALKPVAAHTQDLNPVVKRYCAGCHSDKGKAGGLSLAAFDVTHAAQNPEVAEKVIRKLQAGFMPPPLAPRPDAATYAALITTLESDVDAAAAVETESRRPHLPAPESSRVRARDSRSARARRRRRQLAAARHQERELRQHRRRAGAVADAARGLSQRGERDQPHGGRRSPRADGRSTYSSPGYVSQHPWDHVDGAPYGTRGGSVVEHVFPADAEYVFEVDLVSGSNARFEDIDISIDGERVALIEYETGPAGGADGRGAVPMRTEPILIKAGQHLVAAAFVRKTDGPYEDLIRPHDWSFAGGGSGGPGITTLPHVRDLIIKGPYRATGDLGDGEPREDLQLPSDQRGRGAPVRAADPHAARQRGLPSSAHAAASWTG